MAKITLIRISKQFEHFLKNLKESFWAICTENAAGLEQFWEAQSIRERDSYTRLAGITYGAECAERLAERLV